MAVIEVDQDYLDRYAEVLILRREMLREFGRMLADDPRLLSRYMDLIKRRRSSLRDQLAELAERQDEIATEVSGWLAADELQRDEVWTLVAEMRLQTTTGLAKDAASLTEQIKNQMPLELEADQRAAALVIQHAEEVASQSRATSFNTRQAIQKAGVADGTLMIAKSAEELAQHFVELDAALDQLGFDNELDEEVTSYVNTRLVESRTVADQADAWSKTARHIERKEFHGLAESDQQSLGIATELLRVEMLDMESDLEAQFQQQGSSSVPGPIIDMVRDLHRLMEGITLNQAAATFAMSQD